MRKPLPKRRRAPAAGSLGTINKTLRTGIVFEEEMYRRIQGEANRRQLSFSAIVREKLEQFYQVEEELFTGGVESVDNSVELKSERKP